MGASPVSNVRAADALPGRPVLRYHGGKWRLAPWILGFFPPHFTYVEPYGGAASCLLLKPRSVHELYNDLDGEVVNLFRVLRDPVMAMELREKVALTPYHRQEFELGYKPADEPIEQARRTLVRAHMGIGSSGSVGKATGFRVRENKRAVSPAMDWARWPEQVAAYCERLRGVMIEHRPALDVIRQQDAENTLFYVDPPYVTSTRTAHHGLGLYRHEMTDGDHREMAAALHQVRGMVVLSGYASPLYDALFGNWRRFTRQAFAGHATTRTEVVWLNPNASQRAQRQLNLYAEDAETTNGH